MDLSLRDDPPHHELSVSEQESQGQDSREAQQLSDVALDFLGLHAWTANQAYSHQTWLILLSFLFIIVLNRVVPRLAMFDRGRCLPWAMATPCTVCEELCPTSPKAIWVEEADVPRRTGVGEAQSLQTVRVKRPHVDPSLCIGCGACEKVCPVVDKPAVYVTSAGESRSKTNVILLEGTAYTSS